MASHSSKNASHWAGAIAGAEVHGRDYEVGKHGSRILTISLKRLTMLYTAFVSALCARTRAASTIPDLYALDGAS